MIRNLLRAVARRFGYRITLLGTSEGFSDIPKEHVAIYDQCRAFTMTGEARIYALIAATEYIVRAGIQGAFVECGVWRGGSAMAMLHTLARLGDTRREIYLYDTFAGMTAPASEHDGAQEKALYQEFRRSDGSSDWCRSELDEVKANIARTGYPMDSIHFVQGRVEDTIPGVAPEKIALLRLDTDWYESTRHELQNLYPRLVSGGCMILDDYGQWQGSRKAVDEYFAASGIPGMLHRIDSSARAFIKP
jgi:hypothetical protein